MHPETQKKKIKKERESQHYFYFFNSHFEGNPTVAPKAA